MRAAFRTLALLSLFMLALVAYDRGYLPWASNFIDNYLTFGQVDGLLGPARLVRVTDGDTIVVQLKGQEEKVRLIGVDTPETFVTDKLRRDMETTGLDQETIRRLGKEATQLTEALTQGKRIYLELDATERDRYRRLLAYVYVKSEAGDWQFGGETFKQVNLELIEAGWAEPLTIPPNVRYSDRYVRAGQSARNADKGMWSER